MRSCTKCHVAKPLEGFYPDPSKRDGRHTVCKECQKADRRQRWLASPEYRARANEYSKAWHRRNSGRKAAARRALRLEMVEAYGGKCACCGEWRVEFLTMDHVGGWGKDHRAADTRATSRLPQLLKELGWPRGGFQLLCWNCNCAHGIYGHCPHQTEV